MLFQNEDFRMARETKQGLGKLDVGESLPISSSWAPPASGSWAGRYSPQHIWVVSFPPSSMPTSPSGAMDFDKPVPSPPPPASVSYFTHGIWKCYVPPFVTICHIL